MKQFFKLLLILLTIFTVGTAAQFALPIAGLVLVTMLVILFFLELSTIANKPTGRQIEEYPVGSFIYVTGNETHLVHYLTVGCEYRVIGYRSEEILIVDWTGGRHQYIHVDDLEKVTR